MTPTSDPWFMRINEFARDTPWLHPIMIGYADYGIVVFAVLLAAGWWIARRGGDLTALAAAVWAPLGALAAVAISEPLAAVIAEPRPDAMLPDILVLAQRVSESFPSDSSVLAGAVAAGLLPVGSRLGTVAALAAAAMAFARVYIGADYTHDVLLGLGFGVAVSVLGFWATRPILLRVLARAEQSRLVRPLLTVAEPADGSSR